MARRTSRPRSGRVRSTRRRNVVVSSSSIAKPEAVHAEESASRHLFKISEREVLYTEAGARTTGAARTIDLSQHDPDDLIEVTLSNGARLYTTLGQYLHDYPPEPAREVTKPHEYFLPLILDFGGPSRGGLGLTVKLLKLLGLDPIDKGAKLTAIKLAERYERSQLQATDGDPQRLWRCETTLNKPFALTEAVCAQDLPVDRPVLVFLHGTALSTVGSFSDLWKAEEGLDVLNELVTQYGKHIYGFEHRTLSESPIENAIALLDYFPKNARVHLVSHSRGGMVGELLCRGQRQGADPFTDKDIEFAYDQATGREQEHKALLAALSAKLKEKGIKVERFVRVACPTRGTSALGERMDRWLSAILEVLAFALPTGLGEFYEICKEFALALIQRRTKAEDLPGLQAMVPESALVRLLNAPEPTTQAELRVAADLHVIAGDIEGGRWWKRLGIWVTDLFYESQHDLIVHTPAMYGGASRPQETPARFYFTRGEDVNHFSYFSRTETRQKLIDGLTKAPAQDKYAEFDPPTKLRNARAARAKGTESDPKRPPVVLLPGIMGSELTAGNDKLWLSGRLLFGALDRLAINKKNISPTGLMDSAYADLIDFLAKTHNVVPFPYDWRLSLSEEADRLNDTLLPWLEQAKQHNQPVSIIAHSMGGLLARVLIVKHGDTWKQLLEHPDARLLMLGTPNGGSHVICQVLTRRQRLVQGLAVADMKHNAREVIDIVKRFPGLLEMLPTYQTGSDFFELNTWQRLAQEDGNYWTPPREDDLATAKTTRTLLDQPISEVTLDRIRYIAGYADETPSALKGGPPPRPLHEEQERWLISTSEEKLYFESSPRGDGWVLWDSGVPQGVAVWYSQAAHGDLADNEDDFPAILDLLQLGTTSRLPQRPPAVASRSITDRPSVFHPRKLERFPDDELLEAMALGKAKKQKQRRVAGAGRFQVGVAHGNLIYARYPVAVGHYQGDTIISSESVLNAQLDGRLAMCRNLDLYPGLIGTCEVFLNVDGKFPGAVVVGLGRVGELTPGKLTDTFTRAVLKFALSEHERKLPSDKDEVLGIQLSTLLIGTTAGGLQLRDSLASLLRGVANANRELSRKGIPVRLEYLEILELWEDRAIEAVKSLAALSRDAELGKSFKSEPTIVPLRGKRKRTYYAEIPGWWERLQIAVGTQGELKFTRLTDRARAEVTLLPTQRGIVERYLDEATAESVTQPQVARTLFELLLPNEIKERATDERNVVLVVDDQAARYPWELMEDGLVRDRNGDFVARDTQNATDGIKPLAVRAGLIRQRLSEVYRPEPRLSLDNVALVVGHPTLNWPELFKELPGAQAEANAVADVLRTAHDGRGAFEVDSCIAADSSNIVNKLFSRPYRILHLAGHGVHNFVAQGESALQGWLEDAAQEDRHFRVEEHAPTPDGQHPWFQVMHAPSASGARLFQFQQGELISGMVIGRNVFLTPKEIRQMRVVPEFVFINCCFCGKDMAPPRGRSQLAASLATQLIEMGVRAVIAAGWAVHDEAAKLFAETFYDEMLHGVTFGQAVHQARKTVYEKYENTVNTWGAYQCYGDPDYRLLDHRTREDEDDEIRFVSEAEAIAEIENLHQSALTARESNVSWLKRRLPKLEKVAVDRWPESGALYTAIGCAYGELDMFEEAIKNYERALSVERADVDLKALEQLANLKARHAEFLAHQTHGKKEENTKALKDANARIDEAEKLLDKLMKLGVPVDSSRLSTETAERFALKGSLTKRRAMITAIEGKDARSALTQMKTYYAKAAEIAKGAEPYHIVQQILAETLGANGHLKEPKRSSLLEKLQAGRNKDEDQTDQKRDFWSRAGVADYMLVRALIEGNLGDCVDDVIEHYRDAQSRGASLREWRSIVENLNFIQVLIGSLWPRKARTEILAALRRIYQGLEFFLVEDETRSVRAAHSSRSSRRQKKAGG